MIYSLLGLAGLMGAQTGFNMLSTSASAKESYKYTRRLQQQQQEWMEKMSNTAHQREVDDLRLAGLNPILSANGNGATVGSASSPAIHAQAPNADLLGSLSTIAQLKKMESAIDLDKAQTKKLDAETSEIKSDTAAKNFPVGADVEYTKPGGRELREFQIGDTFFKVNRNLSIREFSALQALSNKSKDLSIKEQELDLKKAGVSISERDLERRIDKTLEDIKAIKARTDLSWYQKQKLIQDISLGYVRAVTGN